MNDDTRMEPNPAYQPCIDLQQSEQQIYDACISTLDASCTNCNNARQECLNNEQLCQDCVKEPICQTALG